MRKGIELIELPWLKQNLGAQVFRDLAGMCGTFENQDWLAQDDGRQAEKETGARRRAHGCRGSERVAAETGVRGSRWMRLPIPRGPVASATNPAVRVQKMLVRRARTLRARARAHARHEINQARPDQLASGIQ
jgi:hypothetical protein